MVEQEETLFDVINATSNEYDADIYLYSGSIDHAGFGNLVQAYLPQSRKNAILMLTTYGGLANSAYKIAKFLQSNYENLFVVIPSVCKSAGTLVAIGGNRLIMTDFSELGPLDVQLYEKDEIAARKSGLMIHSAFEALKSETFDLYEHVLLSIKQRSGDNVSFPVASNIAGEIASKAMAPIYQQISPLSLGSDYRDLRVAIEYGNRLAINSNNIEFNGIKFLTEHYPSHDFIIDIQEARQLFKNVDEPSDNLYKIIRHFADFVFTPREEGIVICLNSISESSRENRNEGAEVDREGSSEEPVDHS